MFLWIESQEPSVIAVLTFGACYGLALLVYAGTRSIAASPLGMDLRATTPVMLTPLAVIAGLLIAFLASRVWTNLDRAHALVAEEASAISETVLLLHDLPVDARSGIHRALSDYLHFVEAEDWPAMAADRADLRGPPAPLGDAITVLLSIVPERDGQRLAQQRATVALERALYARRSRILLSQGAIAPIQWIVVIVLDILILIVIASVHLDRPRTMTANLLIMSTAVATCLVLLLVNDRPFAAGGFNIEPDALRQIRLD